MFSGPATGLWISPNPWNAVPEGSLAVADDVVFTAPGVIEPRRGFDEGASFGESDSLADQLAYYGTQALLAYDFTRVAYLDDGDAAFTDFLETFAPNGANRMRFEPAARSMFFNPNDGIRVWDGVGNPSLANAAMVTGIFFAYDGAAGSAVSASVVTNGANGSTCVSEGALTNPAGTIYARTATITAPGVFTNNQALSSGAWTGDVNGSALPAYLALSPALAGWAAGQVVTGRTSGATGVIVTNVLAGLYRVLTLTTVTGTFVDETIDLSNGTLGQPYAAGCPLGLAIGVTPVNGSGWAPENIAAAYRFTICRKDAFGRVIEGPPSGRAVFRNAFAQAIGLMVHAGGASQIVTFGTTETYLDLAPGDEITIGPGETYFPAGTFTIASVVTPGYEFTYDSGVPNAGAPVNNTVVEYVTYAGAAELEMTLPVQSTGQISTNNFLRVYRSEATESADIVPGDEMFQCYESPFLTASEVSTGVVTFTDTTPESQLEVPLYTNPNTGDGTLAANFQPPIAEDFVYWQDRMWFVNTANRHAATLTLIGIGSPDGLQDGDTITIVPDDPVQTTITLTAATTPGGPTEFQIFTDQDPAFNIQRTAEAMIAALNQQTGTVAYGYYVSSESGAPGMVLLQAPNFTSFTGDGSFSVYSSRATTWTPQLPSTDSPLFAPLKSENNRHAARLWYSKLGQPEAVPLLNYEQIDADNNPALRVFPLNYRLLVFKTDGVYFVPNSFPPSLQKLSDEVLLAPDSVQRLGDSVYFLSDRGLMVVDESGVREVGKPIDLALTELNEPTAVVNVSERSVGIAYRSEDFYALFLPERTADVVSADTAQAFVDCRKGNGFTRFGFGVRCGVVGPDGALAVCPTDDNRLWLERKSLTAEDFYDVGDVAISCRVTFNPFTNGEPAVTKMAQQASFLFRKNSVPIITAEFASEIHPARVGVELETLGWGAFPWGQVPWGGSAAPLRRVQPLPVEVANCCQLSVGFSADVEGTKFVFLGVDVDSAGDTRQSRDA